MRMMTYAVVVVLGLAVIAQVCSQQAAGPSTPVAAATCDTLGKYAADTLNVCWYHQCLIDAGTGDLVWVPRRCGWGTIMSHNFVEGFTNICTINLSATALHTANTCVRTGAAVETPPACSSTTLCDNGGTPTFEGDICWCLCPADFQGDFDCSRPTLPVHGLPPGSDICVNGAPLDDWCSNAGGCLNGGTCFNQCDSFWCDCGEVNALSADHIGKRCETAP